MWYKGNLKRCEDYNAIVSYDQSYEGIPNRNAEHGMEKSGRGITDEWGEIIEIEGDFYIKKHPDHEGTYLTEVQELPLTIELT